MRLFNLVLILLLQFFFNSINCKVTLTYRLKNYENPEDRAANGWLCDAHYFDTCDPVFFICFGSYSSSCGIYNQQEDHQNSHLIISNVNNGKFEFDYLEYIYLHVTVEDQDIYYHDLIARFSANIPLTQLPISFTKSLYRIEGHHRVSMDVEIDARCSTNYYGPQCKKYCLNSGTYFCDSNGRKHCQLSCGAHGRCKWYLDDDEFICTCNPGYSGSPCRLITTTTSVYNTTSQMITKTTYTTTTNDATTAATTTNTTASSNSTNQVELYFDIDINDNNTNVESSRRKLVSLSILSFEINLSLVLSVYVILVVILVAIILSVVIRWYKRKQ